jgi:PAS domain S-box-containing protein
MNSGPNRLLSRMVRSDSRSALVLVCVVATLSYLAPRLEGALISNPQTVWPLWPGCAILVSGLLLVPLRIWPILIPVALAGFCLYDLQVGVPVGSVAWFMLSDTVQVLVAALGLRYCFDDLPRLNSIKALAKYSFFAVILAPFLAAFLSARGIGGDYWNGWRVCFFSEVLAFVTLTPAILSWITEGPSWARKPRACHLEAAALTVGLVLLGYIAFTASTSSNSPALLYSLVPLLLWSALRFGSIGISSSVIVVAFLSIWSAVHGRGPFAEQGSHSILSLQLFLVSAAAPFMILAALVEDRKLASRELALANDRLLLAMEAGTSVAWDLDVRSGRDLWVGNLQTVFGIPADTRVGDAQDFIRYVHPDDRQRVSDALADARQDRKLYAPEFRIVRPDGMIRWLVARGKFYYATNGAPERMLGVSLDITERRLAEKAVRESDSRYRRIVETTNEGVWLLDSNLHTSYVNRQMAEMIGYEPGEIIGQSVFNFYFPEDIGYKKQVLERRQQGVREQIEERLRRKDGSELWVRMAAIPVYKDNGEFDGALAMVSDITERKRTEDALSAVSQRLIQAQEQERTRIARELHDDIGQRLAMLAMQLQELHLNSPDLLPEVRSHTGELWKRTNEIATDIQSLSHELHSSKLQYLGIAAAIRGFCREFSAQQNVEIDFQNHDLPSHLQPDTSLCLFRVLQEALHNSAKHSGVRHFEVRLWGTSGEIHLTVSDSGSGFDSVVASEARGLGLISMEERLKALNGTLSIESQPERGTTIRARIPLKSDSKPMRAAG